MIGRILDLLIRRSMRKARQGNGAWMAVGAAAWLWRRARARRIPHPVWTEELGPGQSVLIVHEGA